MAERVYCYWGFDYGSPVPRPGERVTLPSGPFKGRTGRVDTAKASEGALEKRKLTIVLDPAPSKGTRS